MNAQEVPVGLEDLVDNVKNQTEAEVKTMRDKLLTELCHRKIIALANFLQKINGEHERLLAEFDDMVSSHFRYSQIVIGICG